MATRGLFVTGTDTGVGKTVVSCAIVAALRARGLRVGVYKPIETGCTLRDGRRVGEDCERLAAAAGNVQAAGSVASYLLREPAAPLVAARAERLTIDTSRLVQDYADIAERYDYVLVEGAGGLLVPITEGFSYRELARALELPVLCVVASRLGCISHARLTMEAVAAAALPLAGYVINQMQPAASLADRTNADVLRELSPARPIGRFPVIAPDASPAALAQLAEKHLTLDALLG